ncbi:MAG: hypothetical protein IKE42_13770 [Aquamicrobium sp.]|jgi:hypothetical protein|uniref:hypothetical protein n=1 Tax=Mesorhizobium TaxID=68287 RepID=UPI0010108C43|nr:MULTISPECIES: hypothetical protein [Mesorhizobium]MBR2688914.1 hypothetical protein [Aquamicrobium sp.]QAZ42806.1 hypothetical protein C1M53_07340 [Mesorhizobium sp. Pch-S]
MSRVQLKAADGTVVELDPANVVEIRQFDGKAQVEQVTSDPSVPRRITLAEKPWRVAMLLNAAIGKTRFGNSAGDHGR